jgi:hypothetical protein
MKYAAGDLTAYTLGGTSYLADFTNVSFKVGVKTEEGKAGAARHAQSTPVKRMFEAKTEVMRTVTTTRQTSLTVTVASIVASITAKLRSCTINVTTASQECSALADGFETYQATGTKFTGSGVLQILDADTTTLMETVNNATLSSVETTLSLSVGGVVLVLPITLTSAEIATERDGLILVNIEFEQRGTPTTVSGSTLLTSVLTGTTLIAFVATITTIGTYTGSTLIDSATFTVPEQGIVTEQYNFKGLGTLVKS